MMATPEPEALGNAAAADAEPQGRTAYRTQANALFRKNLIYQVLQSNQIHKTFHANFRTFHASAISLALRRREGEGERFFGGGIAICDAMNVNE